MRLLLATKSFLIFFLSIWLSFVYGKQRKSCLSLISNRRSCMCEMVLCFNQGCGSGKRKKPGMWKKAGSEKNRDVTKDVEAGSGKTPGMWKREAVLFLWKWKRKREILPLPLPHRLFELSSNLAKKFCPFPNVD